jgi:hypothetical protein
MKVFISVMVLAFIFCQNEEDCKLGNINIGSLSKLKANSAESVQSDLPKDFNYSSSDMKRAMVGSWFNKNNDTVLSVIIGQDSRIEYNIAIEGTKCGPTFAKLFFQCNSNISPPLIFSGSLTFYDSSDSGEVQLEISNKPYRMSHFLNKNDSYYTIIPITDISELDLSKGDSLKLSK